MYRSKVSAGGFASPRCISMISPSSAAFSGLTKNSRVSHASASSRERPRSMASYISRVGRMPVREPHGGMRSSASDKRRKTAVFAARLSTRFSSSPPRTAFAVTVISRAPSSCARSTHVSPVSVCVWVICTSPASGRIGTSPRNRRTTSPSSGYSHSTLVVRRMEFIDETLF